MRLINRSRKSPTERAACEAALTEHHMRFGEYGIQGKRTNYTVKVNGKKIFVEVVNGESSYIATAMTGARRLTDLPGRVSPW
ncbi:DUF4060 family protein [Entomohabitans teleogrylli]|uniref:DUF4060 family protein n=1 Tax=Entomohabitans teleogrylli TaxID=1384589 RepID=UPI0008FC793D|nr:DUF4060 family protein [Entomohabitans teleogrylli]